MTDAAEVAKYQDPAREDFTCRSSGSRLGPTIVERARLWAGIDSSFLRALSL